MQEEFRENLAAQAVGGIINEYGKPDRIGMTGQMHGILYVDDDGKAITPFYTWQDGNGNQFMETGRTYAAVLREETGAAATGYGLTTHFFLQKNDMIPKDARKMVTISDYIAMKLCGRSNPGELGSISGISADNFYPGAMTVGIMQGILGELYEMYQEMCRMTGTKAIHLAGSGNGIRRNALMQELAEELFQMPMEIPACQEEAAYGAALQALQGVELNHIDF